MAHVEDHVCRTRSMANSMMAVTAVAAQLGATAMEADAIWLTIQRQEVPRVPSEFYTRVGAVLGQVRREMSDL